MLSRRWFQIWIQPAPPLLLGLGTDPEKLKYYAEAELMNARWAMMAVAGICYTEVTGIAVRIIAAFGVSLQHSVSAFGAAFAGTPNLFSPLSRSNAGQTPAALSSVASCWVVGWVFSFS